MSTNAVTFDGQLVNTDAHGNRVGALTFGPKRVIVIARAKKAVEDVDEARKRIKQFVAPLNGKRHELKHGRPARPCSDTGTCVDCRHPQRICCITVIIEYQRRPPPGVDPRLNVILVGEELGL